MELQTIEIWIMFLTLILAPVIYSIRENSHENKRIDVLLNKTREEVASPCIFSICRLVEKLRNFS